jgi:hypothetical protein
MSIDAQLTSLFQQIRGKIADSPPPQRPALVTAIDLAESVFRFIAVQSQESGLDSQQGSSALVATQASEEALPAILEGIKAMHIRD